LRLSLFARRYTLYNICVIYSSDEWPCVGWWGGVGYETRLFGERESRTGDNVLFEAFETFEPSLCLIQRATTPSHTFYIYYYTHYKTIYYIPTVYRVPNLTLIYIYIILFVCPCLCSRARFAPVEIYLLCDRTRYRERDLF